MDLEKKVATSEPLVKSLSFKNKMLKNKVAILTAKAENDKEGVTTFEKSLQVEKDFSKLKDKQIGDLGAETTECWGHGDTRLQRL